MKKAVHILLLVALLPMVGSGREETLEERKKRITRKYLRQSMKVTQSDLLVPTDEMEDEQVTGSEQYKDLDTQFERQEAGAPMPPPPQQRPVPLQTSENWLLADPELDADPFTDPFDPYKSGTKTETDNDYWALFGGRPGEASSSESSRKQAYNPYAGRNPQAESRDRGIFGTRSLSERTGISEQRDMGGTLPGSLGSREPKTYGSSPESGLLKTPFSQREAEDPGSAREAQQRIPYKIPYQYDRELRQQQQGIQTPKIEYTKPDAFQEWKSRNKAWDPTKDDAYLDELMRKNRR